MYCQCLQEEGGTYHKPRSLVSIILSVYCQSITSSRKLAKAIQDNKSKLSDITKNDLQFVVDKINKRPRKSLGYLTPYEVFYNKKLRFKIEPTRVIYLQIFFVLTTYL